MGCKKPTLLFIKSRGIDSSGVVQTFMYWVGNGGVDINWDVSPVSSPFTVLSQRGKFLLEVKEFKMCRYTFNSESSEDQSY